MRSAHRQFAGSQPENSDALETVIDLDGSRPAPPSHPKVQYADADGREIPSSEAKPGHTEPRHDLIKYRSHTHNVPMLCGRVVASQAIALAMRDRRGRQVARLTTIRADREGNWHMVAPAFRLGSLVSFVDTNCENPGDDNSLVSVDETYESPKGDGCNFEDWVMYGRSYAIEVNDEISNSRNANREHTLIASTTDTIGEIKRIILKKEGIPRCRLIPKTEEHSHADSGSFAFLSCKADKEEEPEEPEHLFLPEKCPICKNKVSARLIHVSIHHLFIQPVSMAHARAVHSPQPHTISLLQCPAAVRTCETAQSWRGLLGLHTRTYVIARDFPAQGSGARLLPRADASGRQSRGCGKRRRSSEYREPLSLQPLSITHRTVTVMVHATTDAVVIVSASNTLRQEAHPLMVLAAGVFSCETNREGCSARPRFGRCEAKRDNSMRSSTG